jgi:steroid delta-isomerase-like uncharacterized protein
MSEASKEKNLAETFLERVWGPTHDLAAIDELMTEDYAIVTAGAVIRGRDVFKRWVAEFQQKLRDARTISVESFADKAGERIVSRWVCTGRNNGIFGLPADGQPVSFTGIAIWRVQGQRLAECWVERSALELYLKLSGQAHTPGR